MEKFKNFRKYGKFSLSSGIEVPGELSLNGGATLLNLYGGSLINTYASEDITGTFHDGSRVSLIGCVKMSETSSGANGNERYDSSSIFPHFVLFGDEHITSADRKICQVSFVVDDAPSIFYDFDAFGLVIDARPHMARIAEAKQGGRTIEIGEHPHIFYFTGKHEIFVVGTAIGKVSATHGISYTMPGPEGIHVRNAIRVNIIFATERRVNEAIANVIDTLRFLEIVAGRPQNIVELVFFLQVSEGERAKILDAYWCLPPRRQNDNESHRPHPADLPLQAGRYPDKFAKVLARWLERHGEWRNARERYATASAYQSRYETDRLVGAANMFDIMPVAACPAVGPQSLDLEKARNDACKSFRALPSSPERDSVLNTLGRVGKPSLKRKIRSRVGLITNVVGAKFPELELVADEAINCRNYYVHGTRGRFDYGTHDDQPIFFTDTLEFIFAAADLIEAGWDIGQWINEGTTMSHPFGRYRVSYAERLAALKKLLT